MKKHRRHTVALTMVEAKHNNFKKTVKCNKLRCCRI